MIYYSVVYYTYIFAKFLLFDYFFPRSYKMSVVSDGCRVDPRTKRMITLMDRIDLEDKYIELYEENIVIVYTMHIVH